MRIVIAEDAAVVRAGLVEILLDRGHEVLAAVGNAEDLLAAVDEHLPAAAVVDVRMPPSYTDEGLRAAIVIRRDHPNTGVLVFSQYIETRYTADLLGASRRTLGLGSLTARERDVLALMAEGRSNGAIAGILVISERAVEKHVGNIFSKLGLAPSDADHRRVLAVLRYLQP